jgi:hypothetical protein
MTDTLHKPQSSEGGERKQSLNTSETKKSWLRNPWTIGGAAVLIAGAAGIGIGAASNGSANAETVTPPQSTEGTSEVIEGADEMFPDSAGNFLNKEEMETRNTLISICTTGDDALDVKGAWINEQQPLSFEAVLEQALDGKPASASSDAVRSVIKDFPEGAKHLSEVTDSCADVVSLLPYISSPDEIDFQLAASREMGLEGADFKALHDITFPIING